MDAFIDFNYNKLKEALDRKYKEYRQNTLEAYGVNNYEDLNEEDNEIKIVIPITLKSLDYDPSINVLNINCDIDGIGEVIITEELKINTLLDIIQGSIDKLKEAKEVLRRLEELKIE